MLFQVNFKFVHASGKLRSDALVLEAKTTGDAQSLAIQQIKEEHDHFEITRVQPFGTRPATK